MVMKRPFMTRTPGCRLEEDQLDRNAQSTRELARDIDGNSSRFPGRSIALGQDWIGKVDRCPQRATLG